MVVSYQIVATVTIVTQDTTADRAGIKPATWTDDLGPEAASLDSKVFPQSAPREDSATLRWMMGLPHAWSRSAVLETLKYILLRLEQNLENLETDSKNV